MIVGLYIITPILKKITEDKRITEYFLILSLIFTFIIPTLLKIPVFSKLETFYSNINFYLTLGYSSYFVLGYYINTNEFSNKARKIIYVLSFLGFVITILGSALVANYKMEPFGLYGNISINVLLESIGIFVFVKNLRFKIKPKLKKIIYKLSKYTFGIYLVHVLIIDLLAKAGIFMIPFNTVVLIPVIVIITYIISLIISAILNHIQILNKYIV